MTSASAAAAQYSSLDEKIAKMRKTKHKATDDDDIDDNDDNDDDNAMDVDDDKSSSDERRLQQGVLTLT